MINRKETLMKTFIGPQPYDYTQPLRPLNETRLLDLYEQRKAALNLPDLETPTSDTDQLDLVKNLLKVIQMQEDIIKELTAKAE